MAWRKLGFKNFGIMMYVSRRLANRIPNSIRRAGSVLGLGAPPAHSSSAANAEPSTPAARELQARVDALDWYHTLDLGNGVVTRGLMDLRETLHEYPIPARLDGKRVLDVATSDGFWAFEFERRGAAEVVGMDLGEPSQIDMPPRLREKTDFRLATRTIKCFQLAHEALNSRVRREIISVYDLSPERLGTFDFVFASDLLLHLMNPMKALNNIRSVTRGHALVVDTYDPGLPDPLMSYESGERNTVWWVMSFGALEQMIEDAGFSRVELRNRFRVGFRGEKGGWWRAAFEAWP